MFVLDEERLLTTPGGIPTQPPQEPALNLQPHTNIKDTSRGKIINVNTVSEPHHYHPAEKNYSQMTAATPIQEEENEGKEGELVEKTRYEEEPTPTSCVNHNFLPSSLCILAGT